MINKTVINKIKKKIKPLMPDSAYTYFIKWLEVIAIEPELSQTTVDKWKKLNNLIYETLINTTCSYTVEVVTDDGFPLVDLLSPGTDIKLGKMECQHIADDLTDDILNSLVSEPVEDKPKWEQLIIQHSSNGKTKIYYDGILDNELEAGIPWGISHWVIKPDIYPVALANSLASEPVEDEIEIATRVYNRWSTEKYVDHFGIYEPFPLWLSNRRKDA